MLKHETKFSTPHFAIFKAKYINWLSFKDIICTHGLFNSSLHCTYNVRPHLWSLEYEGSLLWLAFPAGQLTD